MGVLYDSKITIGVLALQGAFSEHINLLSRMANVTAITVKSESELNSCDGLILPGGESTTIALNAHNCNLIGPLKEFIKKKPVWGTCAGLILLSNHASQLKQGGQELIGGLEVTVKRNAFGNQVDSFVSPLKVLGMQSDFMGVFIRSPLIETVGKGVEVLARVEKGIVAVRQGRILATSFHPELTNDSRFHELFVEMIFKSL
jgi:5'-phosphate synthase pdxT subunit